MWDQCCRIICCCCEVQPQMPPPRSVRKTRKPAIQYRLNTKYKKQDFIQLSQQERKAGKVKAYPCPLCTYYFNRILGCSQCANCVCYNCFQLYDKRNVQKNARMKCPFCNSTKSVFKDYELDPHSYFDTTNKAFLSKEERVKIDRQIKQLKPAGNSMQLSLVPQRTERVQDVEIASQP